MFDAVREAIDFSKDKTREDLNNNRQLSLALVRLLEIIGEAANGVSESLRNEHEHIPWKGMAGMRNRLIHGYWDINLDIVWQTIQQDLPLLASQLEVLLKDIN
ncbi:MAG: DUF86 domain-containing protein [Sedimentisphaerales bacterium]|nr:DUF86 domain-containing protein [Sedimentisphaerales bacterium]